MVQPNNAGIELPTDDVVGHPVVTKSVMGFEVIYTPWWVVLLEGVIAVIVGLFLLYRPVNLTGKEKKSPRIEFFYFSDDGDLVALRYDNWKMVFMEQRAVGTLKVWAEPFILLRVPKIFNLRTDPYERADQTSNTYYDWLLDRAFLVIPTQGIVGDFLVTFKEFPPRQKAASFTIDQVMEKLLLGIGST